jgi:hypothetical protein
MQRNALAARRSTINLTVLVAVSKFKALGFRAKARRAKTKYRKQIESDDRRWGGRRLKLSGRAVCPIPAGIMFINERFESAKCGDDCNTNEVYDAKFR